MYAFGGEKLVHNAIVSGWHNGRQRIINETSATNLGQSIEARPPFQDHRTTASFILIHSKQKRTYHLDCNNLVDFGDTHRTTAVCHFPVNVLLHAMEKKN